MEIFVTFVVVEDSPVPLRLGREQLCSGKHKSGYFEIIFLCTRKFSTVGMFPNEVVSDQD